MKSIILLALGLLATTSYAESNKTLTFNANGKFKIVQFTDVHFGEDEPDDTDNARLVNDILDQEKPDLVVLTGDIVTGYEWDGKTRPWTAIQYAKMVQPLQDKGYYWASACGNHDSEGDLTREELSELDRSYANSLTKPNAANISHAFNYWLPVYDQKGENVSFRLWFLDTGRDNCLDRLGWGCANPDQISWFREENFKIDPSDSSKGKGFLFFHIPIPEYVNLFNDYSFYGNKNEHVACASVNTGMFSAIVE
jgi:3',5'-cyclic AMP phosphodiesterase CpdA